MPEALKNSENIEEETNIETVLGGAISAEEREATADPVTSSWLARRFGDVFRAERDLGDAVFKRAVKAPAKYTAKYTAGFAARFLPVFIPGLLLGLLKFAKVAIAKKGNVGFSEGYKIGENILPSEGGKNN